MARVLFILLFLLLGSSLLFAESGIKKKRPRAYDYGQVIINNFFDHDGPLSSDL